MNIFLPRQRNSERGSPLGKSRSLAIVFAVLSAIGATQAVTQTVSLDNTGGSIVNNGTIIIRKGNTKSMPDTIGGHVMFVGKSVELTQEVPNLIYNKLTVSGASTKNVVAQTSHPLITRDSLLAYCSLDAAVAEIHAKGDVYNGVDIANNWVRLNGTERQSLAGKGFFKKLELDNSSGASIVGDDGEFVVRDQLNLTVGTLANGASNNLKIADDGLIVRTDKSAVSSALIFGNDISVHYVGSGDILTGGEVPLDTISLKRLSAMNIGVLSLHAPLWVQSELEIGTRLNTYIGQNQFALHFLSAAEPMWIGDEAQIAGTIHRTQVRTDNTPVHFSNRYSFVQFATSAVAGDIDQMSWTVFPNTFPQFPRGDRKVERSIAINAMNSNGSPSSIPSTATIGYGWRNSPSDTLKDETNSLKIPSLVFQKLNAQQRWIAAGTRTVPTVPTDETWAFGTSDVNSLLTGDYAIGGDISVTLKLTANAMLEGAYRGNGQMGIELRQQRLIPTMPPNFFPYSLDPLRTDIKVTSIPENVVDWVVMELRSTPSGGSKFYQTGFLLNDGRVVDIDGRSDMSIFDADEGNYYVALHHRNHLSVMTDSTVFVSINGPSQPIDYTRGLGVLGGTNAQKALGRVGTGSILFGLVAGDINGDGVVDRRDYNQVWTDHDGETLLNTDTSLNGIVTTLDANKSWNNRGRSTAVPK